MRIADVFVGVHADLTAFRRAMGELNRNISTSTGRIGAELTKTGKSMTTFGSSMTHNVTLPILAVGAATGKMALDFNNALTKVVALTDVTAAEIGGVRDQILQLSPAIGKGPVELADAFYFLASAGFNAQESMDVLTIAAKASAAGLGETQDVAKTIGAVVNAYGTENLSAARATDILVAAIGQGTAEAPEFAASIGQVVGSAAQIGASFSDLSAALASLTLTGLDASEAAVSLNQVFVTLFKPTTQGAKALASYGMSAAGLRAEIKDKGLLPVLQELATAFDGDAEATAAVFGNVRALRGILALTGPAASKTAVVFDKVANSTGDLNEAVSTYLASPGAKLNIAFAKLQVAAIEIGEDVLPVVAEVLGEVADNAKALAGWWESLGSGTKSLIVHMAGLLATIGPVVFVLGKLTHGLGLLLTGISKVTGPGALGRLNAMLSTKLGLVGLLALAYTGLRAVTGPLDDFANGIIHGSAAVQQMANWTKVFGDEMQGNLLGHQLSEWGVSATLFAQVMEVTGTDAVGAFKLIADAGGDARGIVARALNGMADDARESMVHTNQAVTTGATGVTTATGVMWDTVKGMGDKAVANAAQAATDIISALENGLAEGPDTLKDELKALRKALESPYKVPARRKDIEKALGDDLIKDLLTSDDPVIAAKGATLVKHLLDEYDLLAPGALARGKLLNPALQKGVNSNMQALLTYLRTKMRDPTMSMFDMAKVLDGMGYSDVAAFVRGLIRAKDAELHERRVKVGARVREMFNLDHQSYMEGLSAGENLARGLADGIITNTYRPANATKHMLSYVGKQLPISSPPEDPSSPLANIYNVGGIMVDAITSGIRRNLRDARAAGQQLSGALSPQLAYAGMSGMTASRSRYEPTAAATAQGGGGNTYNITTGSVPREKSTLEIAREMRRAERLGMLPDWDKRR